MCLVCERKHTSRENAKKCEQKGIAIPEFQYLEVAEYQGENEELKDKKVIVTGRGHRLYLKPTYVHELPSYYQVDYFYNEWGSPSTKRVGYASLKKIMDFKGDYCLICGSQDVVDSVKKNYEVSTSLYPDKLPTFNEVPCKECPKCKRKFLTSEQRIEIEKKIKAAVQKQEH